MNEFDSRKIIIKLIMVWIVFVVFCFNNLVYVIYIFRVKIINNRNLK